MNFLQNDWVDYLLFAIYINNDFHYSIIQITSFKVNIEKHFVFFTLYFYHDKFTSANTEKKIKEIIKLQKKLTHKLIEAQNHQVRYYNKKHTSFTFNEND